MKVKSLFISDVHIGNPVRKPDVERFMNTIRSVEFQHLFLLGDIFELRHRPSQIQIDCLKEISQYPDVTLVHGNHDSLLGNFNNINGIKIVETMDYHTVSGKYKLLHGHQYDGPQKSGVKLVLWEIVQMFFALCHKLETKKQITGFLKNFTKHSDLYTDYYKNIENDLDDSYAGALFGHIHLPDKRVINNKKIMNTGDWVHHNSYIIEDLHGDFHNVATA